jgi:superfamily II DNA or RNA helicase/HKD family nuclease/predicted house-cleaning noncanonical NTP pyrophosphatase (MazG superfamily)
LASEKLIRSRITEIAASEGKTLDTRAPLSSEVTYFLRRKLAEEVHEVIGALDTGSQDMLKDKLADLVEVIDALATSRMFSLPDVLERAKERTKKRGNLIDGHILRGIHPEPRRLFTNDAKASLLRELQKEISKASAIDIAVSFILESGLDLLEGGIAAAILRGCTVRILTTDYMGVSEPAALRRINRLVPSARVFEATNRGFHPKAYIFYRPDGSGRAFIGSANLSRSALLENVEWTWSSTDIDAGHPIDQTRAKFEEIFDSASCSHLNSDWIDAYEARRPDIQRRAFFEPLNANDPGVQPRPVQILALNELELLRQDGETKGLVVAATGLGKTYLAALDSRHYDRMLFIAHREELLTQAEKAFRRMRPDLTSGFLVAGKSDLDRDMVFASIQSLSMETNLEAVSKLRFDYVVIDEFHHAAADSYQRVLKQLAPAFLLGITATPFRRDNRDLLAICDGNLAFQIGLFEAIRLEWLAPFRYYGIADVVHFSDSLLSPSKRYDEQKLTVAFNTETRAALSLEHYLRHRRRSALGFCVSIQHADYMAEFFRSRGVKATAVHSQLSGPERELALLRLESGEYEVIFSVDLFNEGVDIPFLDLVLFLRPTESMTIFLQQMGRGLRVFKGKDFLTVIDLIGNYRNVEQKISFLLGDDGVNTSEERAALRSARSFLSNGVLPSSLPEGIELHLDQVSTEVLRRAFGQREGIAERCRQELRRLSDELNGSLSFRHFNKYSTIAWPSVKAALARSSWLEVLDECALITPGQAQLLENYRDFFLELERSQMTKSYKMVVLLSMFSGNLFVPSVRLGVLVSGFREFFRSERWRIDLIGTSLQEVDLATDEQIGTYILQNPVNAWIGGNSASASRFFSYSADQQVFAYAGPPVPTDPATLRDFSNEILDRINTRLDSYFRRPGAQKYVFPVIPAGNREDSWCVMFGEHREGLPFGWAVVRINGQTYSAKFVKVALNVLVDHNAKGSDAPNLLSRELLMLFERKMPPRPRVRFVKNAGEAVWEILIA